MWRTMPFNMLVMWILFIALTGWFLFEVIKETIGITKVELEIQKLLKREKQKRSKK